MWWFMDNHPKTPFLPHLCQFCPLVSNGLLVGQGQYLHKQKQQHLLPTNNYKQHKLNMNKCQWTHTHSIPIEATGTQPCPQIQIVHTQYATMPISQGQYAYNVPRPSQGAPWKGRNSLRCTKILSQHHHFMYFLLGPFLPCKDTFVDDLMEYKIVMVYNIILLKNLTTFDSLFL